MEIQSTAVVHQSSETLSANSKHSIGESSINSKNLNENFNNMVEGQRDANARGKSKSDGQLTLGRKIDIMA